MVGQPEKMTMTVAAAACYPLRLPAADRLIETSAPTYPAADSRHPVETHDQKEEGVGCCLRRLAEAFEEEEAHTND